MAKFEINIYDHNDKVVKTHQRNKCPVELFLKFQQYSEKVTGEQITNDGDFFAGLKELFLELFPDMTENEYMNNTDVAEVIVLYSTVVRKATQFTSAKNA